MTDLKLAYLPSEMDMPKELFDDGFVRQCISGFGGTRNAIEVATDDEIIAKAYKDRGVKVRPLVLPVSNSIVTNNITKKD